MTNRINRRRRHKRHKARTAAAWRIWENLPPSWRKLDIEIRAMVRAFNAADLRGLIWHLKQPKHKPEFGVAE